MCRYVHSVTAVSCSFSMALTNLCLHILKFQNWTRRNHSGAFAQRILRLHYLKVILKKKKKEERQAERKPHCKRKHGEVKHLNSRVRYKKESRMTRKWSRTHFWRTNSLRTFFFLYLSFFCLHMSFLFNSRPFWLYFFVSLLYFFYLCVIYFPFLYRSF